MRMERISVQLREVQENEEIAEAVKVAELVVTKDDKILIIL